MFRFPLSARWPRAVLLALLAGALSEARAADVILSADLGLAEVREYKDGEAVGDVGNPASNLTVHVREPGLVRGTGDKAQPGVELAGGGLPLGDVGLSWRIPQEVGTADLLRLRGSVVFTPLEVSGPRGVFQMAINRDAWMTTSSSATALHVVLEGNLNLKYTSPAGPAVAAKLKPNVTYRLEYTLDFLGDKPGAWGFTLSEGESGGSEIFHSGALQTRAASIAPGILALAAGGGGESPFVRVRRADLQVDEIKKDTGVKRVQNAAKKVEKPRAPEPDLACGNAVVPGKILLFPKGESPAIEFPVRNNLSRELAAEYIVTLVDRKGVELRRTEGKLLLPAAGLAPVTYTLKTDDLKLGVYSVILNVKDSGGAVRTEREYYVGVSTATKIPKSPDGGFLYGIDPKYGAVASEYGLLEWIDAIGADIMRAGYQFEAMSLRRTVPPFLEKDLPLLRERGIRVMGMAGPQDPPNGKEPYPNWFEKELAKRLEQVEDFARKAPDIIFWELGNEPDLGYPDMALYVQVYEKMYEAVKRGNPNAIVMNGAVTFWGPKGEKNAPKFFELVNPARLDMIAYHAHGPGIEQEKRIYESVRAVAEKYGMGNKPMVDTESGVPAKSKMQEDVQARTVLQKQIFAQSVGLKFLMSFRLHAFSSERGWGFLRSNEEPQPAVLAYRTMTENLKGLAYGESLPVVQPHVEAHTFSAPADVRRAVVLWSGQPAFYNVYLKIAGSAQEVGQARIVDLYGNSTPAELAPDGTVRVEVTEAPVYVLWDAAKPEFKAAVADSLLEAPGMAEVIPNGTSALKVIVKNPSQYPVESRLSAAIFAQGEASTEPAAVDVKVPPGGSVPVDFALHWNPHREGLRWPASWMVFTGVEVSKADATTLTSVPLEWAGKTGRRMKPVAGTLQFLQPGESLVEKNPAFIFGSVHSDRDQVVRIGASADWWMECRVDGKVVYSTLEAGNGGAGTAADHFIDLPLRKGENLISFLVLSGKGGWKLALASPSELPALLDAAKAMNCVDLTLEAQGKVLARERLGLLAVQAVQEMNGKSASDPLAKWQAEEPDFLFENAHVTNLYDKQPDRSKWWQGDLDLSATAWLRADAERVHLLVWVRDDRDVTGSEPARLWGFDSLQIGLSREGAAIDQYAVGRVNGKTTVTREISSRSLPPGPVTGGPGELSADVEREGGGTWYRVSFPRTLVGDGVFRLNFLINDNDDGFRKQFAELSGGLGLEKNPRIWKQFILPAKPR